jgi:hypothetical protein
LNRAYLWRLCNVAFAVAALLDLLLRSLLGTRGEVRTVIYAADFPSIIGQLGESQIWLEDNPAYQLVQAQENSCAKTLQIAWKALNIWSTCSDHRFAYLELSQKK